MWWWWWWWWGLRGLILKIYTGERIVITKQIVLIVRKAYIFLMFASCDSSLLKIECCTG